MAQLISAANGNFTDAATWKLVDSTSLLDSEGNTASLNNTYKQSSTFTPGAITIDGIAVKLRSRSTTVDGTITVSLYNNAAAADVAGTEVAIDAADLPECSVTQNEGGWIFFKFASPVTLLAATAYRVQAKTSSATSGIVNLWTDATTNNLSRMLRTTTTQAPVAGDIIHVMGEHTGSGTGNNIVVTMNETATTDYGPGTDNTVALTISKRGTLSYGTTAATNYYLKVSGDIIVYSGGTFNRGTVASPIPRDSTAILEFDPGSDGVNGLLIRNGSTFVSQGLSRSSGKNIIACKLNTDEASGQTVLGVDTDTGWLNGDQIVVEKTTRSASDEAELETLAANATATELTIASGLNVSHSGTSPTQANVILLTRNNIIRSGSAHVFYINIAPTAIVDIDWTRIENIGDSTAGKRGVVIQTTTGSFSMEYSSLVNTEDYGINITGGTTNNIVFRHNACYSLNTARLNGVTFFLIDATTGTTGIDISYNYFFTVGGAGGSTPIFSFNDIGFTFSHNVINNILNGVAMYFNENGGRMGDFSYNTVTGHRGGGGPCVGQNLAVYIGGGSFDNFTAYNNVTQSVRITAGALNWTVNNLLIHGSASPGLQLSGGFSNVTFNDCIIAGNSLASAITALDIGANTVAKDVVFKNCKFGITESIFLPVTTDINCAYSAVEFLFDNCQFGSPTLITNYTSLDSSSEIKFKDFNTTVNDHRWYRKGGIARSTGTGLADTTVNTAGSLAIRIAPEDATDGFTWEFKIPARVGFATYFLAKMRKNAAFGTDDVVVELYEPGSSTPDATFTLGDTTDAWQVANLAHAFAGSVDGYATIKIIAKSATSAAYLYIDDLYNAGLSNKVAGLDIWDEGKPSEIMIEQTFNAQSVWAVDPATLTTDDTIGKFIVDMDGKVDDAAALALL